MAENSASSKSGLKPAFIRNATLADYKACRVLTNQKQNREGFGMFDALSFNDFASCQQTDDRYMLIIAEDPAHNIIGFLRALRLRNNSQTTIHAICRDFNERGRGIGALLMNEVERRSRVHNIPRIFLKSPKNIRAHESFESMGFAWIRDEPPIAGHKRQRTVSHFEKILTQL